MSQKILRTKISGQRRQLCTSRNSVRHANHKIAHATWAASVWKYHLSTTRMPKICTPKITYKLNVEKLQCEDRKSVRICASQAHAHVLAIKYHDEQRDDIASNCFGRGVRVHPERVHALPEAAQVDTSVVRENGSTHGSAGTKAIWDEDDTIELALRWTDNKMDFHQMFGILM